MRISDWSSDVCSSDLRPRAGNIADRFAAINRHHIDEILRIDIDDPQLGRTPFPQRLVRLQLIAPVLLRTQLGIAGIAVVVRSEEHTSELQSLMRISYAVFCLKKKKHSSVQYNFFTTLLTNDIETS